MTLMTQEENLEQTIWQAFDLMDQGQSQVALDLLDGLQVAETSPLYYDYLSTYGYVYADLKRYEEALTSYQTYLEHALAQGDTSHQHMAHHQLAMVYRLMGDYPTALASLDQERQLIDQHFATDDFVWSVHLYEVAYLSFLSGDNSRAAELMQSSLDYAQKTDDLIAQACAHRGLGEILGQASHFERAKALFEQAGDDLGAKEVDELLAKLN